MTSRFPDTRFPDTEGVAGEWTNWSGNQRCRPRQWWRPGSEQELAERVRLAGPGLRVAGAGHSFSAVVPTDDTCLSLVGLSGIRSIDVARRQVTCGSGTAIRDLGRPLHDHGLALTNQGDVDFQTIAGACTTGTHGTGAELGCLATDLIAFRLVTAAGEVVSCDATSNPDLFHAGAISLGAFGVWSEVTLQCRAAYALREKIEVMPCHDCLEQAASLADGHRHFEFFQFPYADRVLVKTMNLAPSPSNPSQADEREDRLFRWACDLARQFPAINPWLQRMAMRWYPGRERRDHAYRVFPSARTVRFNEMEYEVPAEAGVACYRDVLAALRQLPKTVCFPLEFRRVKRDSLWISPFYERDSVSISVHQHWRDDYRPLFQAVEPVFWKYQGRPHWGKLHSLTSRQLRQLYPRWRDFQSLRRELDPLGKFLNDHLRMLFMESPAADGPLPSPAPSAG